MKETLSKIKLVLVFIQHPVLGPMLVPFTALTTSDDTIELIEQAFHAAPAVIAEMEDAEKKAIDIASRYTEKYLMKVYSKETNVHDFLRKITDKKLKEIIRPFIDKKLAEMIELVRNYHIPVYQNRPGNKVLYDHSAFCVSPYITEVSFHFKADEKHFSYSLQCTQNGEPVSLLDKKPVTVLTSSYITAIFLGNELFIFRDIEASRIIPFTNKAVVSVDVSLTDKYLEQIVLPVIRYHKVTSKGLNIVKESRNLEAILSVENNIYEKTLFSLAFRYGNQLFYPKEGNIGKFATLVKEEEKSVIYYFDRDVEKENRLIVLLKESGLQQVDDSHFRIRLSAPEKDLTEWISNHRQMITENFLLTNAARKVEYSLENVSIEQDITEGHDWFDLHITVIVGELRIPFIRFRRHIIEGRREYKLPDGRIILLPEEWFNVYSDLLEYGTDSSDDESKIQVQRSFAGVITPIINFDKKDKNTVYQKKENVAPPQGLKAILRQYQQEGFNWMVHLYKHSLGGCLADDMGLGKTLQTLTLLQYIYESDRAEIDSTEIDTTHEPEFEIVTATITPSGQLSLFGELTEENTLPARGNAGKPTQQTTPKKRPATLVVVPTSLIHNWRKEISRFTTLAVFEYTNSYHSKRVDLKRVFDHYHIVLTTYGIMRNNVDDLSKYLFEYIILDESQSIKNSDSMTFKSVILLQSNNRLVLTGTPIENSLKDLWSQFYFLQPGLLGSESDFQSRFIVPIKQGNKRVENTLQRLIEPFVLRRSKQEVAPELPSLTEEIIYCNMQGEQEEIYTREKNIFRNSLIDITKSSEEKRNSLTVLNGILRLRQLASHPGMVYEDFTESSGKLENIITVFETLRSEGHKVLIFSSFVKHLEIIGRAFSQRGWEYALLTGSTRNREEEIARFSGSDHIQAFLISLKAGGVGLNLTQADYVFIVDPWWNPAAEMQAISRAHRIGQDKQVIAYRFITQNSIEEKIINLQEEKRRLADTFISDSNPLETLTDREWQDLILNS